MKKKQQSDNTLAKNRKAFHDYFIEQTLEGGLCLQGWEVKALRKGRGQLKESYIKVLRGEIWLIGCHISQLENTSTHFKTDPTRTRKILLHKKEISTLIGKVEQKGYTIVPLALYLKNGKIKISVGLARGKKQHDKRKSIKDRDTKLQVQRAVKQY